MTGEGERAGNSGRATEAVQKNDELISIFDLGIGISEINLQTGQFTRVNREFCEILGYSSDELLGMTSDEVTYPEDREAGMSRKWTAEKRYVRKDGEIIWVKVIGTANNQRLLSVVEDITGQKQYEDKLRNLSKAVEQSPASIIITDGQGRIQYVNNTLSELTGYSPQEVMGKTPGVFKSGLTAKETYDSLWNTILSGKPWTGEILNRKKGGELYWEHVSIFPMTDNEGEITNFVAIKEDITQEKKYEEELRLSEERYALAQAAANIGSWDWNIETGDLKWSGTIEPMFGLAPGKFEANYNAFLDRVHPEDRKLLIDSVNECVKEGKEHNIEFRIVWLDGTVRWISEKGNVIRNAKGKAVRMLGIVQDITGRKSMEEEFRKTSQFNTYLLSSLPFVMDVVDEQGNILFISEKSLSLLGDDAIGKKCWEVYRDNRKQCAGCPLKEIIIGETAVLESEGCLGGSTLLITHTGIMYNNRKAVLEIFQDITERKKNEEQVKASLKEKEVLLKEIHHRVTNNLQVISSLLNLQAGRARDENALKALQESQNRIRSMALVHEKLYQSGDLSRIDFGEYAEKLVGNLLTSYGVDTGRIGIEMKIGKMPLNIDKIIVCGLILNELVSNSLKYAFPKGKGRIYIGLEQGPDSMIKLTVSDNGVGLPKGFEPKNSESLGLQLVEALTSQLEGKLEMERRNGVMFRISFSA